MLMHVCEQERDIAVDDQAGGRRLFTRSEMRDKGQSWASRTANKRAAEYDVIYDRLKDVLVQLTVKTNRPQTMDDAVKHVVQTEGVCEAGGVTMYKYMEQCRAWRKAKTLAAKQATAVAAAAGTADEVGDGVEVDASQEVEV